MATSFVYFSLLLFFTSLDLVSSSTRRQDVYSSSTRMQRQGGAAAVSNIAVEAVQSRIGHRLKMLFPLLLAIAARLSSLIPIGIGILTGVGMMVIFSGKAFIVSLLAFGISFWDSIAKKSETKKSKTLYYKIKHEHENVENPFGDFGYYSSPSQRLAIDKNIVGNSYKVPTFHITPDHYQVINRQYKEDHPIHYHPHTYSYVPHY